MPADKIEVVAINDAQEEPQQTVVPHERQVVEAVIALWKEDASTESLGFGKLHGLVKKKHPNWQLSEKRVKVLLKQYGLAQSGDQSAFSYAKDITSLPTPHVTLPKTVLIVMTSKRGKCLYAKTAIKKGDLIWEEKPLFAVPLLAHYSLIASGKACTHCGKLGSVSSAGETVLRGLDCNICSEIWCSLTCKKMDQTIHSALKHGLRATAKQIDAEAFHSLTEYCLKEQWNALYAIAMIYAFIVLDKTGVKGEQFKAMARVSQKIRYKALNSSAGAFDSLQGGALFVEEQQEELWKDGYLRFLRAFPKAAELVSMDEFLHMMGTYNINNLDLSVFLLQSHLNHNCAPNCEVETALQKYKGVKVVAARDIKSGEELTTTYVNPSHTLQQRQRELRVNWGFICKCQKCKDDEQIQHRRKSSTGAHQKEKAEIRHMLANSTEATDGEFEIPLDFNGERRKSVRFDEKVVKVTQT
ncbi:hypothetical protein PUMCH_004587 [Australozyma saopauloensis]|uniref:Histone-lysine N-methyltransferase SET5 n=1 Tax=Australozyma saopauloensis TaxID=291208 RepID=A0AAX4HHA1_9ASCO|nr:hypothetical protein PUMCH_004587 [[Candida] saopauloensis]